LAFGVQSDLSFIFLASWKGEVVPTCCFRSVYRGRLTVYSFYGAGCFTYGL